jgi:hypothetical protein
MKNLKIHWINHAIELIVVFLGISAGFLLQNHNETAREKEMELNYLGGFNNDILENIETLETQIKFDSTWITRINYAIHQILDGSLSYDSACSLMKGMAEFSRFTSQNVTYLNIISSGNLDLIRDYELRQSIVEYYHEVDEFDLVEVYLHNFSQDNFIPFMLENYDIFDKKLKSEEIHKQLSFKNMVAIMVSFRQQRLAEYRELRNSSLKVQEKIGI